MKIENRLRRLPIGSTIRLFRKHRFRLEFLTAFVCNEIGPGRWRRVESTADWMSNGKDPANKADFAIEINHDEPLAYLKCQTMRSKYKRTIKVKNMKIDSDRVASQDVADLLRQAIKGKVSFGPQVSGQTWERCRGTNFVMRIGGNIVVFFNDEDAVDYVARVEWQDGRDGNINCNAWRDHQPLDLLTNSETVALETLVKNAGHATQ